MIPGDVLARAGLDASDHLVFEADEGGVRIVPDALRKVYVEATARCNLDRPMCIRHAWQESPDDMPLERYAKLLDGLPPVGPDRLTLAFGGFGEPLVHPSWLEMMREARARRAAC
jgi:MoaA/NifB/PqqE/SkfB family radical SAM enzyme